MKLPASERPPRLPTLSLTGWTVGLGGTGVATAAGFVVGVAAAGLAVGVGVGTVAGAQATRDAARTTINTNGADFSMIWPSFSLLLEAQRTRRKPLSGSVYVIS